MKSRWPLSVATRALERRSTTHDSGKSPTMATRDPPPGPPPPQGPATARFTGHSKSNLLQEATNGGVFCEARRRVASLMRHTLQI